MTHQTGPHGKQVHRLYIEEGSAIDKEFYLVDADRPRDIAVAVVVSTEGGMNIEEVAHDTPDKIATISVDPVSGICPHHARTVAHALKLDADLAKQLGPLLSNLYKAFVDTDMSSQINPLVVTKDKKLICLDAKVDFDNNALFLHPTIWLCATKPRKMPRKSKRRSSISTISRSTARSAAWSTAPASPWRPWTSSSLRHGAGEFPRRRWQRHQGSVSAAFKIITSDHNVKGILVNIFGGIMKCDVIAEGVVAAVKEVGLKVPLVVRLEGTNVDLGKKIIAESKLNVTSADDLDDAAQKIVKAVKEAA